MKPNVGKGEAVARVAIGLAAGIIALRYAKSRKTSALLGAVAASGIETGLSRYCPVSDLFGVDRAPELSESPIHHSR